jgi:hypothetical protein
MKTISTLIKTSLLGIVAMASVNGYSQTFLTNGLVAYYPFSGNVNDASGNGNNGIVYGATLTTDRFGLTNSAYYFNGASAYISVPLHGNVFSNDFTASVWFDAYDLTNGWPGLLDEQNAAFRLQIAGDFCGCGRPNALVSYSGTLPNWSLLGTNKTPVNTYCQVVVTKSGSNVVMFLNGQMLLTNQAAAPVTQIGSYLNIGSDFLLDSDSFYHGVIDDIRIYNRALSTTEVQQLFAYESAPIINICKAVYLTSENLHPGTNYQLQVSSDLVNWTNSGSVFTTTTNVWASTNYWNVDNWNQLFFRLQQP